MKVGCPHLNKDNFKKKKKVMCFTWDDENTSETKREELVRPRVTPIEVKIHYYVSRLYAMR